MSVQRTRSGGQPSNVHQGPLKKTSTKGTKKLAVKSATPTLKKTANTPAHMEESPESEDNMDPDSSPAISVHRMPKTLKKYGSKYKYALKSSALQSTLVSHLRLPN